MKNSIPCLFSVLLLPYRNMKSEALSGGQEVIKENVSKHIV